MSSAELSGRVEKVVGYRPLCDTDDRQRREFQEALLDAERFGGPAREVAGCDFVSRARRAELRARPR